ncbi:RDD family protein [Sorangium sp. So ce296]|uniref:RDD family protein n=1 Tax=Sorangium sp. So ce296 TaxID=3133296 RepID=UPI003F645104
MSFARWPGLYIRTALPPALFRRPPCPLSRPSGLRVVGPDGGRPSLNQALVREAFTLVGSIPIVGPLLALAAWVWIDMTIRSSPLRQGKHDLLAGGTRVVRVR